LPRGERLPPARRLPIAGRRRTAEVSVAEHLSVNSAGQRQRGDQSEGS